MMITAMTSTLEVLSRMREHNEHVHGATAGDYKFDAFGWHRRAFPTCAGPARNAPLHERTMRLGVRL